MTPRAQADAPPTPDEMRVDENDFGDGLLLHSLADRLEQMGETDGAEDVRRAYNHIARLTAALHSAAARAEARGMEAVAKIADERQIADRERYQSETDWRQPYASNRVIRASMDIAAEARNCAAAILAQTPPCDGCAKGMPLVSTAKRRLHDRGDGIAVECTNPPAAPADTEKVK